MATIDDAVAGLSALAKKLSPALKRLGIETIRDLLLYFPVGHEDRTRLTPLRELHGQFDPVTTKGRIELLQSKRSFYRKQIICEGVVGDGTSSLRVVWFGNKFIHHILKVGDEVYLTGRVTEDRYGLQMSSPEFEKVNKEESIHHAKIVPRYALTKNITQRHLRSIMTSALPTASELVDWIPHTLRDRHGFMLLSDAITKIHFPKDFKELRLASKRLAFDELFRVQLRAGLTRRELHSTTAVSISIQETLLKEWVLKLPFTLTDDQKKSAWQIIQDMTRGYPMNRMLAGDVGSGKTAVAALVIQHSHLGGYLSVLMAPTDILVRQHFETLQKLFAGTECTIGLYTRTQHLFCGMTQEEMTKKEFIKLLKKGAVDILVGTHALIYEPVEFHKLALVVVDEQHRFGVGQRRKLKERSVEKYAPHFLSMTATPIPRTVALTLYGELDVSVIKEKPKGRKPIITRIAAEQNRDVAYAFIANQIDRGRQVFVVCPLIDPSDELEVSSVEETYVVLKDGPFKKYAVAMLHGKMKPSEKEEIMKKMVAREIDVLVATSVIEVGVDVQNASVMMIEGAERFGLAQLHQFRGRIGRAQHQSYCILFPSVAVRHIPERLSIFEKINDGFVLAERDLELRGAGDLYGIQQSGFPDLKIAQLSDIELVELATLEATRIINEDPELNKYPELWTSVKEWEEGSVHME